MKADTIIIYTIFLSLFSSWALGMVDPAYSSIAYPADSIYINITTPQIVGLVKDSNDSPVTNETLVLSIDNNYIATVTSDINGVWAYQLTSDQSLADGTHLVSAFAQQSGVTLTPHSFVVDTHVPESPVISSPATGSTIFSNTLTVSGSTASFCTIALFIDEGSTPLETTADAFGTWSIDLALTDGSHSIAAQTQNLAGTKSSLSIPLTFTISGS